MKSVVLESGMGAAETWPSDHFIIYNPPPLTDRDVEQELSWNLGDDD